MRDVVSLEANDDAVWFDVRFLFASHGSFKWRVREPDGTTVYEGPEGYSWDAVEDVFRLPLKARNLVGRGLQLRATAATGTGQSDMAGVEVRIARAVEPGNAATAQRLKDSRQTVRLSEGELARFEFVLVFQEKP